MDGGEKMGKVEFRKALEGRSRLEAMAGKAASKPMLTMDEQVERFPWLKNAPVEGNFVKGLDLKFKPLGKTVNNVKCRRCGEWGHQSGARECTMSNEVSSKHLTRGMYSSTQYSSST